MHQAFTLGDAPEQYHEQKKAVQSERRRHIRDAAWAVSTSFPDELDRRWNVLRRGILTGLANVHCRHGFTPTKG